MKGECKIEIEKDQFHVYFYQWIVKETQREREREREREILPAGACVIKQ